jgi:hypothetical protein
MLVIRVELWPGGDKARAREIANATVSNVSHLAGISDYDVRAAERASEVTGLSDVQAGFPVRGHNRHQSVWALVAKVAVGASRRFNGGAA